MAEPYPDTGRGRLPLGAMRRAHTAALVILLAACGGDDDTMVDIPDYEATVTAPNVITVLTDATDPDQLRVIFDKVRADHSDGDAWWVSINCASVPATTGSEPRLANGRFANTPRGAARTGLATINDIEFSTTQRTSCRS